MNFTGTSFEEMVAFLRTGSDMDIETFDSRGNKTLRDLYRELTEREVVLQHNPTTNVITRCAQSVKVEICNTRTRMVYYERRRRYSNGVIIENPDANWAIRETRRRGELAFHCARRGLWEELGRWVNRKELKPHPYRVSDVMNVHASTVYPNIESLVTTSWFRWTTKHFDFEQHRIINDGSVQIELEAVPYRLPNFS